MILTVTLNTALDTTYHVPRLEPDTSHRVDAVRTRAGGKGVNVARVLRALGAEVLVTGLVGASDAAAVRAELADAGLPEALVEVPGDTRRTVTVVSTQDGQATVFNEPGPEVPATGWADFLATYRDLVGRASVVVLSGSLPPGLTDDAYAELIRAADGTVTILDTSGPPLLAGLPARPDLIKPNHAELSDATGIPSPEPAAEALHLLGAGTVVASLGAQGLLAVTAQDTWRALPSERVDGNPTGAGDACVAALAAGKAAGTPWPELLADAVAVSAAAVASPVAGDIDAATRHRIRPTVHVEKMHARTNR